LTLNIYREIFWSFKLKINKRKLDDLVNLTVTKLDSRIFFWPGMTITKVFPFFKKERRERSNYINTEKEGGVIIEERVDDPKEINWRNFLWLNIFTIDHQETRETEMLSAHSQTSSYFLDKKFFIDWFANEGDYSPTFWNFVKKESEERLISSTIRKSPSAEEISELNRVELSVFIKRLELEL
jgi:hypothetical protein